MNCVAACAGSVVRTKIAVWVGLRPPPLGCVDEVAALPLQADSDRLPRAIIAAIERASRMRVLRLTLTCMRVFSLRVNELRQQKTGGD